MRTWPAQAKGCGCCARAARRSPTGSSPRESWPRPVSARRQQNGPSRPTAEADGDLVRLIGLQGFERAYPRALSAGMAKMVEVARVLATNPSVLLLDEPFGSLDAQTRARMQAALGTLWEERRTTVVMVTHDVDEAIQLADRVVVLSPRPGRVAPKVRVDVPRPRTLEVRLSPSFIAMKRTIWSALGLAN